MGKYRNVTIEDVRYYIRNVCKYYLKVTAKQLDSLDEEAYNKLVAEKANALFHEGRFSCTTEYCCEMWDDPDFVPVITDVKIINALSASDRTKLRFMLRVKEIAYPLFKRKCPDLSLQPFGFENTEFSAKNVELRHFVYYSEYQHLASMLMVAMQQTYWDTKKWTNTVIINHINYPVGHLDSSQKKKTEELSNMLKEVMMMFIRIDNHLEVGKRLGLTKRGQYIYDIMDTFICREYYFEQVDAAKEFDHWFGKNWKGWNPDIKEEGKQVDMIIEEFDRITKKYDLNIIDRQHSLNYLLLDMLNLPIHDVPDDDDLLDLDDSDLADD